LRRFPVEREITAEGFESEAMPHLDDIFRTAVRLVMDRAEAEDLLQEVYLQAWKSFDRYEPGTNCRAWLYKILFNKLNHQRRRKFSHGRVLQADEALLAETVAYEPPVPHDLTDEEVIEALDRMPASFREVVLLADVEEFSYKEVAEVLGVPIGTVMSRLSRGRKQLRGALSGVARQYGLKATGQNAAAVV
jgi:RNA polymerase sigma-70 factor (ECF subfamily)